MLHFQNLRINNQVLIISSQFKRNIENKELLKFKDMFGKVIV